MHSVRVCLEIDFFQQLALFFHFLTSFQREHPKRTRQTFAEIKQLFFDTKERNCYTGGVLFSYSYKIGL